jgi:ADP-heptose:LPS heptosyltransferase
MKLNLLVLELWGLGDLALATPFLRAAAEKFSVTLLAKPVAQELQAHLWPAVTVVPFIAPWTAHEGKYRLHQWPWKTISRAVSELRALKFEGGVSARWDPRDHALLWLAGARRRVGFGRRGSGLLLAQNVSRPPVPAHRFDFWQRAARALELGSVVAPAAPADWADRSLVLVHSGAGHPVRVWPLERFQAVVQQLRAAQYRVQVVCDPSQREWWVERGENQVLSPASIADLIKLLDAARIFIGNDSGPGHLAAVLGIPTFTIFGPQLPELFAPIHPNSKWIEGKPCPYKPCFDRCRFPVSFCLWNVMEDEVWPLVERFVQRHAPVPSPPQ